MTTLYLVSAEDQGVKYWKVGVTKHSDPLRRDPKRYLEVFRAVTGLPHNVALKCEQYIKESFQSLAPVFGTETLSAQVQLKNVISLFDALFDAAIKGAKRHSATSYEIRQWRYDFYRETASHETACRKADISVAKRLDKSQFEYDELVAPILTDLAFNVIKFAKPEPMWS